MRAVSDTSPLNYLVLIDAVGILSQLFETVVIPTAVRSELSDPEAPDLVQRWIAQPPDWLQIRSAVSPKEDPELETLHAGEREAILLASDVDADVLLLDELAARRVATERDLAVVGTLGVLNLADEQGVIDATQAVGRLKQTSFRAAPRLYRWLIREHQKRQS